MRCWRRYSGSWLFETRNRQGIWEVTLYNLLPQVLRCFSDVFVEQFCNDAAELAWDDWLSAMERVEVSFGAAQNAVAEVREDGLSGYTDRKMTWEPEPEKGHIGHFLKTCYLGQGIALTFRPMHLTANMTKRDCSWYSVDDCCMLDMPQQLQLL